MEENHKRLTDSPLWISFPFCGLKPETRIYKDTLALHFPLYCTKCKKEYPFDIIQGKLYHATK